MFLYAVRDQRFTCLRDAIRHGYNAHEDIIEWVPFGIHKFTDMKREFFQHDYPTLIGRACPCNTCKGVETYQGELGFSR